jgi:hypothetical protein
MPYEPTDGCTQIVYTRLQADGTTLPTNVLRPELVFAAAAVYASYPGLPDYATLTAADKSAFSEGVALLASARLYGSVTTGAGGSAVLSTKTESTQTTFAPRPASEVQSWVRQAAAAFGRMTYFRAEAIKSAATFTLTKLGGPSRNRIQTGRVTLLDVLTGYAYPYYGDGVPYIAGNF